MCGCFGQGANFYVWSTDSSSDASLANQEMIKDTQVQILDAIAAISLGGGTATEPNQQAILAEIRKLTSGLRAC